MLNMSEQISSGRAYGLDGFLIANLYLYLKKITEENCQHDSMLLMYMF